MIQTIISGGQTGVDRLATDAAITKGVDWGGFIPKGRRSEDGTIPEDYKNYVEAKSANYEVRTMMNVENADGTLIIIHAALRGGSLLTKEYADQVGKPNIVVSVLRFDTLEKAANEVVNWIRKYNIRTLNVAGPRGSNIRKVRNLDKQIYKFIMSIIDKDRDFKDLTFGL